MTPSNSGPANSRSANPGSANPAPANPGPSDPWSSNAGPGAPGPDAPAAAHPGTVGPGTVDTGTPGSEAAAPGPGVPPPAVPGPTDLPAATPAAATPAAPDPAAPDPAAPDPAAPDLAVPDLAVPAPATPNLAAAVAGALAAAPDGPIGVAASGGGDFTALLLLLHDWAARHGRRIEAASVDHGLRPESAAEAAAVAALCARLGVAHATLAWRGWDRRGNLQAAARDARRGLLAAWARERGLAAVALGHTLDDQAETFLLRLARGSGVDGLAAMAPATRAEGALWLRPLLGLRRADLRAWLTARGASWAEDPGNADPAFDRVRARAALAPLASLGLGAERLAATAGRMARARAALEQATRDLAAACLRLGAAGDLTIDPGPFARAPEELRLRLTAGALAWASGARVRPRLAATEAAAAAIAAGGGRGLTAHGCVLRAWRGLAAIRREPAHAGPPVPAGRIWDGRWQVDGAAAEAMAGAEIAALGPAGLAARPRWRDSGLAREALLTTPGLWRDGRLLAAPILDRNPGRAADASPGTSPETGPGAPPRGPVARRVASLAPPWAELR